MLFLLIRVREQSTDRLALTPIANTKGSQDHLRVENLPEGLTANSHTHCSGLLQQTDTEQSQPREETLGVQGSCTQRGSGCSFPVVESWTVINSPGKGVRQYVQSVATREAHLSLGIQGFYWGLVMECGQLPPWATFGLPPLLL